MPPFFFCFFVEQFLLHLCPSVNLRGKVPSFSFLFSQNENTDTPFLSSVRRYIPPRAGFFAGGPVWPTYEFCLRPLGFQCSLDGSRLSGQMDKHTAPLLQNQPGRRGESMQDIGLNLPGFLFRGVEQLYWAGVSGKWGETCFYICSSSIF